MWPFGKNKQSKIQLLDLIDQLYTKVNLERAHDIKKSVLGVREDLVKSPLTKKQFEQIENMLKSVNQVKIANNEVLINKVMFKISQVINQATVVSQQDQVVLKNERSIASISDELEMLQKEVQDAEFKMDAALKTRQKNQWIIYNQRKKSAVAKSNVLQQDLEKTILKTSSIEIASQIKASGELSKELNKQSTIIKMDEITVTAEENNQNAMHIKNENDELTELVGSTSSADDSFEKALEQYLLDEQENNKINNQDNQEKNVI